jgi:hypothetical protein
VAPGNYYAANAILLTSDGTSAAPRWLRYYKPGADNNTNPYHFAESDKAIIQQLDMTGADYWIIDGITIDSEDLPWTTDNSINDSDYNVFNRLECRDNTRCLRFTNGSSYNVIQHCTLYDQDYTDGVMIGLQGSGALPDPKYNRIVSNECWNASDCVQLIKTTSTDIDSFEGTVIYDNDFYQVPSRYTDCAGNLTPTGPCAFSENAIDIKAASSNAAAPVIVAHNRLWGYRLSDPTLASLADYGNAVVDHWGIYNLRFEGNIVWDSTRLYLQGTQKIENVNYSHNLFYAPATPSAFYLQVTDGIALTGNPTISMVLDGNVLGYGNTGKSMLQVNSSVSTSAGFEYINNIHINIPKMSATATLNGTASGNEYYNSVKPAWDTSPSVDVETVVGTGYDTEFCTTIKRITAPETKCFENAVLDTNIGEEPKPPQNLKRH